MSPYFYFYYYFYNITIIIPTSRHQIATGHQPVNNFYRSGGVSGNVTIVILWVRLGRAQC